MTEIFQYILTGVFLIIYLIGMLAIIFSLVGDYKSDYDCWLEEDEALHKFNETRHP